MWVRKDTRRSAAPAEALRPAQVVAAQQAVQALGRTLGLLKLCLCAWPQGSRGRSRSWRTCTRCDGCEFAAILAVTCLSMRRQHARHAVAALVGFVIMTREPSIHVFPADAGRGAEEVWRYRYIGKGEMGGRGFGIATSSESRLHLLASRACVFAYWLQRCRLLNSSKARMTRCAAAGWKASEEYTKSGQPWYVVHQLFFAMPHTNAHTTESAACCHIACKHHSAD